MASPPLPPDIWCLCTSLQAWRIKRNPSEGTSSMKSLWSSLDASACVPGNAPGCGFWSVRGQYGKSIALQVADPFRFKAGTGENQPLPDGSGEHFLPGDGCGKSQIARGAPVQGNAERAAVERRRVWRDGSGSWAATA